MPVKAPGEGGDRSTPVSQGAIDFEMGPFTPAYYPEEVRVTRKRRVKAEDAPCDGEYIADHGGKNRQVHVKGVLLMDNVYSFNSMTDMGAPMAFVSEQWAGEVLLTRSEMSGLRGYDPEMSSWWLSFTIDAKSTGRNVEPNNGGVVSGGGGGAAPVPGP